MSSSSSFAGAGGFMVREEGVFMVKTVESNKKRRVGRGGWAARVVVPAFLIVEVIVEVVCSFT